MARTKKTDEAIRFNRNLGYKLRVAREYLELTEDEMARGVGLNQSTISSYELGRYTPTFEYVYKVAQMCHLTMEDFVALKVGDFIRKLYVG